MKKNKQTWWVAFAAIVLAASAAPAVAADLSDASAIVKKT